MRALPGAIQGAATDNGAMSVHDDDNRELTGGEPWDCGDMACDICSMGPRTGESRADWLERLRAEYRGTMRPSRCGVCGGFKWVGEWCRACHPYKAGSERRLAV